MTPNRRLSDQVMATGALTRRQLLQVGGAGVLTVGLGSLAACAGSTKDRGAQAAGGGGAPKRGGTLRVGATSGGSGDTLDGQNGLTTMDFLRVGALFEQLVRVNGTTGQSELVLAESMEPNATATEWTIRVKPDVTFHNGKPLTAKDVLHSLQRIKDNNFPGATAVAPLDLAAARVMDERTLRIPSQAPYSIFPEGLATCISARVVPEDYDPKKPIGTGPFKFGTFTAGQESSFDRFDGYWQSGRPYLDKLVIINFADETAQINALQSGQVDLIDQLSSASVPLVKSAGGNVVVSKTASFVPFTMRVDKAPFSDVRVRQALRLLVNRKEFNEQVYGGLGVVGNDTFGAADAAYQGAQLPQREQDLGQAKALLRAAGQSQLQVELYASAIGPGAISAASVFATQAKEAGVSVKIRTQDPTQFFSQSYSQVPFAESWWNVGSYLAEAQQGIAKGAPFNEIHQADAGWQKLYDQALATVAPTARGNLVHELLKFDHEQGGYIIPAYFPGIEGMSSRVGGVVQNLTGLPVNGSNWHDLWIDG